MHAIQFLVCDFEEFGIGSTNNPLIDIFYILVTYLLAIVWVLEGEILSWSFLGVRGIVIISLGCCLN